MEDLLNAGDFVTKVQQLFLMHAAVWVSFEVMFLGSHVKVSVYQAATLVLGVMEALLSYQVI